MLHKWLPVVLAVCLFGTFTAGVSTAASTSRSGAKACESSKGVLALRSTKGKCPAHDSKVTLGASGPRGLRGLHGVQGLKGNPGAQGPGALLTEVDSTADADARGQRVPLAGTDLTVRVDCQPGNSVNLLIFGFSTTDTIYIHGTVQVAAATANAAYFQGNDGSDTFTNGTNLVSGESKGSISTALPNFSVTQYDSSDSMYLDLLVNVGSTNTAPNPSFTINGWMYVSPSACQGDAQITPATAPTT